MFPFAENIESGFYYHFLGASECSPAWDYVTSSASRTGVSSTAEKKGVRISKKVVPLKEFLSPRKKWTVFSDEMTRAELCNIIGEGINGFCIVLICIRFGKVKILVVLRSFWFGQSLRHCHKTVSAPGFEVGFWRCGSQPLSQWEHSETLVITVRYAMLFRLAYLGVLIVSCRPLVLKPLGARCQLNRSETDTVSDADTEDAVASSPEKRRKKRRRKRGFSGADVEPKCHKFDAGMSTEPWMDVFCGRCRWQWGTQVSLYDLRPWCLGTW